MNKIKLLLVDDQELIRESLHIVLGMEADIDVVGVAGNGKEAIAMCEVLTPTFVLMDIHMPEMNGVEATGIMKERWPEMKVMILTTFEEVNYVADALGAGAEGYLLKAIHPKDLAAGIRLVSNGGNLIPQGMAKMLLTYNRYDSPTVPDASNAAAGERFTTHGLSERELNVLECLANGLNNKEISAKLFLSEGTVKNYISNIYSKLNVRDRIQAAKIAQTIFR